MPEVYPTMQLYPGPARPLHPTFPSPFDFNVRNPITLVELRMRRLSGMIRQKPRWWEKVHDNALVAKWRAEMIKYDRVAVMEDWNRSVGEEEDEEDVDDEGKGEGEEDGEEEVEEDNEEDEEEEDEEEEDDEDEEEEDLYGPKRWPRDAVTDAQLDYIFAELRYVAGQRDMKTGIHATSIPAVYQSASLIATSLKDTLVRGVAILENVPEEEKDWHPGSNSQVLDLVHPSLYCFRLGKSLVNMKLAQDALPWKDPYDAPTLDVQTLDVQTLEEYLQARSDLHSGRTISRDFQWLPTRFDVSTTGELQRQGYINNLHPIKHASLYPAITAILQRFLPMFERVLSDAASPVPKPTIEVDVLEWYSHVPEKNYDDDGYTEWKANLWPLIPDPPPFAPPTEEGHVDVNLKGRSIRVIVKLANIVLTPESPSYPGGSWHVEGMANENIVATGLYYYASENITESRLAFRMQVGTDPESADTEYQHNDGQGWLAAFGISSRDPLNQELGYVVAAEDKCVGFPNMYQHRVEPFELADHSRPGHRKILAFFLTDPYRVVHSTTMVPPQQREWYLDEMECIPALSKLPRELFDIIANYALEGTITRAEAEADREKLMKERKKFVMEHNKEVFEVDFSMCEH